MTTAPSEITREEDNFEENAKKLPNRFQINILHCLGKLLLIWIQVNQSLNGWKDERNLERPPKMKGKESHMGRPPHK